MRISTGNAGRLVSRLHAIASRLASPAGSDGKPEPDTFCGAAKVAIERHDLRAASDRKIKMHRMICAQPMRLCDLRKRYDRPIRWFLNGNADIVDPREELHDLHAGQHLATSADQDDVRTLKAPKSRCNEQSGRYDGVDCSGRLRFGTDPTEHGARIDDGFRQRRPSAMSASTSATVPMPKTARNARRSVIARARRSGSTDFRAERYRHTDARAWSTRR